LGGPREAVSGCLREQRRSATNHQPYGTYRITDGSPVANTTPPSSPSPVVTTALNLNDIISHRDIGNLIMNECGVLSLGRLQITNKAIRSTITSYNLRTKRVFPARCGGHDHEYATFWATVDRERATERDDRRDGPREVIRAFVTATAPTTPRTAIRTLTQLENEDDSVLGLAQRMRGGEHNAPWTPPTTPESPRNNYTPVYWERPPPFTISMLAPDIIIESTPEPRVLVAETPTPRSTMSIDASPYVPGTLWANETTTGRDDCTPGPPSALLPTAVLNFDAMLPSEVRDRGHLVLTPLILTQPREVVPTAAASEQHGLEGGWEGVEAMEMVR
jgi:hypothetical protein